MLTPYSLSEYGCIKGPRNFEEVASLYGTDMTPVYSGGLVYEYSEEGNDYGLVTINGDGITETTGFTNLETAFKNAQVSGDGGYRSTGSPSTCPTQSDTWDVTAFTGDDLPALPSGAAQYMKSGAGKGPGLDLTGAGSQNAGGQSSATATAGSGAVTGAASHSGSATASASSAAQALLVGELGMAPFVCGAVVFFSTLFGASLL